MPADKPRSADEHGWEVHESSADAMRGAMRLFPLATGALAVIECELEAVHPGGDHDLFVGRVVAVRMGDTRREPLIYHEGGYTTPRPVQRPGEAGAFVVSVRGFDARLQRLRERKRR